MADVAIVGAGNVGANTAFFVAERNLGNVLLHDLEYGTAAGKALDMMEAAPIRGYQYGIRAVESIKDTRDAAVLVVAAGSGREPGMQREDLYLRNLPVIDALAKDLREYPGVVLIATEPVDLMVMRFQKQSRLDRRRVIGLGGALNSARLRHILGRRLGITTEDISATVIGRHAGAMLPLLNYTRINGIPATVLLDEETREWVIEETRSAGDLIVEMSQRASSYYGPSAVAADIVQAVVWNTRRIIPVSFVWDGQYGVRDVAMSLPVILGHSGIERVLEPELTADQVRILAQSAEDIRTILAADADGEQR
jgi:malate dehydrogenase